MLSRYSAFLPLVLSLVAFILNIVALSAGHQKGVLEEYAIARVNTSMLGHDLLQTHQSANDNEDDNDSFLNKVTNKWDEAADDTKNSIGDITNDIADKMANALGISEWYSAHITDACRGSFKPNSTAPGATLNVTACTKSPLSRFDLSGMLDSELSASPLGFTLSDLHWPTEINKAIDSLNHALLGLFVLFIFIIGFSILEFLGCVDFLLTKRSNLICINLWVALLGFLCIFISSIIVTAAAHKGVEQINSFGKGIDISANLGSKFLHLIWISTVLMGSTVVYWAVSLRFKKLEK
ncbi:actin cortical patch SUR7/pH-response regulator pali [Thelonectria olida]|uniref:Actin cortical patch SUR7/pH-response regulator pali n=1 Tax=Thelonectria olida TaxID=1576542 RepID=A0A9P8VYW8_9HYPO|nr:actin cortical patch SUR7/pH-response regulator pali [Thelonectria olida]